jgi:ribosomal protein S18 acetylase RimI-like enzyme
MTVVKIRQATVLDAPVIAKMLGYLADDLGDGDLFSSTGEIIAQHGFGAAPLFHVVIADRDGDAVGFALYFAHFSTTKGQPGVYVQDLWIAPSQRGGGIGQQLLAAVASHSEKSWAAAYIKLAVHADNPRAKQFYERLGFNESLNETPMIAASEAFNALRGAA